jgi:hypothetical protein
LSAERADVHSSGSWVLERSWSVEAAFDLEGGGEGEGDVEASRDGLYPGEKWASMFEMLLEFVGRRKPRPRFKVVVLVPALGG